MAVDRVIGKTDSFEIIFDKIDNDKWTVDVPSYVVGEYIMDLYAYDDAGNLGFMATAMFTVDTTNLCFHIEILNYTADICFANEYFCSVKEVLPCVI